MKGADSALVVLSALIFLLDAAQNGDRLIYRQRRRYTRTSQAGMEKALPGKGRA